jgi:hypothetical protein
MNCGFNQGCSLAPTVLVLPDFMRFHSAAARTTSVTRHRILKMLFATALVACGLALLLLILRPAPGDDTPLASARLADGRILQIEGATFGTNHVIGKRSLVVERFGPWLPAIGIRFLSPKRPQNRIDLERPALVVWVNAVDPATGQQVDCQKIRVELVDEHGDVFGSENSHWFGGNNFWRVGHVFEAFPRSQRDLKFRIKPWRTNQVSEVTFANPRFTAPAFWTGHALPQQRMVGDFTIQLTRLIAATNGGPQRSWESASRYWEPVWELRHRNQPAVGWDAPEWFAEDPTSNYGQHLGTRQPILRFTTTFYPSATNVESTVLLTSCPPVAVTSLQSDVWWNITSRVATDEITVLGILPPGTHHFSEGVYQTNPAPALRMGPVGGGAPSGWVGRGERVSPTRMRYWHGHYTPSPTLYIRIPSSKSKRRFAVRLRDERGHVLIAKPEPQGSPDGISPFLIDLPPEVKTVTAEVILLKPVHASFDVDTTKPGGE